MFQVLNEELFNLFSYLKNLKKGTAELQKINGGELNVFMRDLLNETWQNMQILQFNI